MYPLDVDFTTLRACVSSIPSADDAEIRRVVVVDGGGGDATLLTLFLRRASASSSSSSSRSYVSDAARYRTSTSFCVSFAFTRATSLAAISSGVIPLKSSSRSLFTASYPAAFAALVAASVALTRARSFAVRVARWTSSVSRICHVFSSSRIRALCSFCAFSSAPVVATRSASHF